MTVVRRRIAALAGTAGARPKSGLEWKGASRDRREAMPEIIVYAVEGRSTEAKRALVREITDAVVRNFSVPAENVVVQIVESPKDSKARGGILFSER
ncbi:MAG TPA: tautomerase family protein [Bauldia sp.]|nr:tautomerase family protein [Bauldia sp.]